MGCKQSSGRGEEDESLTFHHGSGASRSLISPSFPSGTNGSGFYSWREGAGGSGFSPPRAEVGGLSSPSRHQSPPLGRARSASIVSAGGKGLPPYIPPAAAGNSRSGTPMRYHTRSAAGTPHLESLPPTVTKEAVDGGGFHLDLSDAYSVRSETFLENSTDTTSAFQHQHQHQQQINGYSSRRIGGRILPPTHPGSKYKLNLDHGGLYAAENNDEYSDSSAGFSLNNPNNNNNNFPSERNSRHLLEVLQLENEALELIDLVSRGSELRLGESQNNNNDNDDDEQEDELLLGGHHQPPFHIAVLVAGHPTTRSEKGSRSRSPSPLPEENDVTTLSYSPPFFPERRGNSSLIATAASEFVAAQESTFTKQETAEINATLNESFRPAPEVPCTRCPRCHLCSVHTLLCHADSRPHQLEGSANSFCSVDVGPYALQSWLICPGAQGPGPKSQPLQISLMALTTILLQCNQTFSLEVSLFILLRLHQTVELLSSQGVDVFSSNGVLTFNPRRGQKKSNDSSSCDGGSHSELRYGDLNCSEIILTLTSTSLAMSAAANEEENIEEEGKRNPTEQEETKNRVPAAKNQSSSLASHPNGSTTSSCHHQNCLQVSLVSMQSSPQFSEIEIKRNGKLYSTAAASRQRRNSSATIQQPSFKLRDVLHPLLLPLLLNRRVTSIPESFWVNLGTLPMCSFLEDFKGFQAKVSELVLAVIRIYRPFKRIAGVRK